MEFYKGMKICNYYSGDSGCPSVVIDVLSTKKTDGSDVNVVITESDYGKNIYHDTYEELKRKFDSGYLKVGGCKVCDVVECKDNPKYTPPPPPDTKYHLEYDVKQYAEMLADCAITGDVYEDQVYKDIMEFLRRKQSLVWKEARELYNYD